MKIARAYIYDCAIVLTCLALTWLALLYVLREVIGLAPNLTIKLTIEVFAVATGMFATSALIALLMHLRRHSEQLYMEDLQGHVPTSPGRADSD